MTCMGASAGFLGACEKAGRGARARLRPERAARDRLDRLAAGAGELPLGLRACRARPVAVLDQRRHRCLHGVRRRLPDPAGLRGRAAVPRARLRGRRLRRARAQPARRGRRARAHRAAAVDAAVLLGRGPADARRPRRCSAIARATSRCTPASGATAIGSGSPRAGARSSTDAPTRRSTARGCGWARARSTARRARSRRCSTRSSSTSRAARAQSCAMYLFVVLADGVDARRAAAGADRRAHPRGLLAAPRPQRDPPDRGGPEDAVGQGRSRCRSRRS